MISSHIQSSILGDRRVYRILLPEQRASEPLPLFILLHGVHGSEIDWTEKADLVNTLKMLSDHKQIGPMAVLTPSDGLRGIGTGYLNWDSEAPDLYEDYLLKELIPLVEKEWKVGGERDIRFIGGLSMGGYATIRMGYNIPICSDLFPA
jgi:enterochelin esterase-like enzyme